MLQTAPAALGAAPAARDKTARSGESGEGGEGLDQHIAFKLVIIMLVISNTLLMGLEADHPEWTLFWFGCENFFTAAFAMEMVFKFFILRKAYFFDRGNLMDFSIAMVAILDCWVLPFVDFGVDGQTLALFRILRLFRLVRVLRLIKGFRKLFLVVSSLVDAMQATLWVAGILLITIYVSAIFCVDLLGRSESALGYPAYTTFDEEIDASEIMQNYNPYIRFGNMSRAMFSLFNIVLSSEWAEIVTPIMLKQPPLVFFFICFVLITTLCTMNVIIGMICDSVVQHHQAIREAEQELDHQQKMNTLQEIQQLVSEMGTDGDGRITYDILRQFFEHGKESKLGALFESSDLKLPVGFTALELHSMLDHNCDGSLDNEEFIQSLHRLVQSDPFQQMCLMQTGLNSLRRLVMDSHKRTRRLINDGQKRTEAMLAEASGAGPGAASHQLSRDRSPGGASGSSDLEGEVSAPLSSVAGESAPAPEGAGAPVEAGSIRPSACATATLETLPWPEFRDLRQSLERPPAGERPPRLARLEGVAHAIEAKIRELLAIAAARERGLRSGEVVRSKLYDETMHTLEAVVHALDGKVSEALNENLGDAMGEAVGVPSSCSWPDREFTAVGQGGSFAVGWPGDGLTAAERSNLSRPVPDYTHAVSHGPYAQFMPADFTARRFAASGGRGRGRGVSIKL